MKKMLYLIMHSTHFIYGHIMAKDYSDNERRDMLLISTNIFFFNAPSHNSIIHTTVCCTSYSHPVSKTSPCF